MDYLKKIPFILSTVMGLIVGVISLIMGTTRNVVYLRIIISLFVFYIIGLYIKKSFYITLNEVKQKELQRQFEIEEEAKKKAMEEEIKKREKLKEKGAFVDSGVELELSPQPIFEEDEGFEPLTVNEVLSTKDEESDPI